MAEKNGEIAALNIKYKKDKFNVDNFIQENKNRIHIPLKQINTKTVYSTHVSSLILEESEKYDLVVIGRTTKSLLYRAVRASIPDTVAEKCAKPLVMVKAGVGLRSWIKRWI